MTSNHDLNRMALMLKLVDMLADKHPTITMDAAVPALRVAIVQAMTEPMTPKLIEQCASDIFASDQLSAELPPWE